MYQPMAMLSPKVDEGCAIGIVVETPREGLDPGKARHQPVGGGGGGVVEKL